jgi:phosphate transport system substrate-binding protein
LNQTTYPHASPFQAVSSSNPGFPSRQIDFVFRKDGNGASLALTNYISGKDAKWGLTPVFVDAVPILGSGQTFSNFIAETGNGAVIDAVDATAGAIGYAESGNLLAALPTHSSTRYAQVYSLNIAGYNQDPIKDLPAAAKTIATFTTDKVPVYQSGVGNVSGTSIGGVTVDPPTPGSGRPSGDLKTASEVYAAGALGIVDPNSDKAPYAGYPIIAVTYLEFYSSGNGIYGDALRFLAQEVSNPASYGLGGITTIDPNTAPAHSGHTGFAQLGILNLFYSNAYIGIDRFIN